MVLQLWVLLDDEVHYLARAADYFSKGILAIHTRPLFQNALVWHPSVLSGFWLALFFANALQPVNGEFIGLAVPLRTLGYHFIVFHGCFILRPIWFWIGVEVQWIVIVVHFLVSSVLRLFMCLLLDLLTRAIISYINSASMFVE